MARVVTVDMVTGTVAYPYDVLQEVHVVNDTVADTPIVVLWAPGTSSALNALTVANGEDVGTATTFSRQLDGRTVTFSWDGERIVDDQTGSEWNVLGQAVSGPKKGSQLAPVVSINHFWFSWAAFRPETRVYGVDKSEVEVRVEDEGKAEDEVEGKVEVSQLQSDFEIEVYQGQDQLGGQTVMLSDVLAQGKPVVLNLWAGLCPTCRAELPHLQAAYDEYGDRVNFVAVDIGPFVRLGDKDDALALLSDLRITIPAGATSQVQIMKDYRVLGTPATYFMKPDGEIVKQHNGILTGDQLSDTIEALIETSAG
jgi:thiol-disulfide isomerase/thioredoxin